MTKLPYRHASFLRLNSIRLGALALVCLLSLVVPRQAQADVYFDLSLRPIYNESNTSLHSTGGNFSGEAQPGTLSSVGYDARGTLGITLFDFLMLGASANSISAKSTRSATANDTDVSAKDDIFEWGPTVGLILGGFHLHFTYMMNGTRKSSDIEKNQAGTVTVNNQSTDKNASGYQAELGYAFPIAKHLFLGPSFIYRQVTYEKQDYTDSLNASNSYSDRVYSTKPVSTNASALLTMLLVF